VRGVAQRVAEPGAEGAGERLDGEQEIGPSRGPPGFSITGDAAGRDEVVHVGVIGEVASPEPVLSLPKGLS